MRTNLRITAAATTALIAALSLSACGSDSGSKESDKAGSKPSASAPATSGTDGGSQGATTAGGSAGTTGGTGGTSGGTGGSGATTGGTGTAKPAKSNGKQSGGQTGSGSGSSKRVTCTGSNVKLTATPVSRPINHVLLTATNIGKTTCNAYDAPAVKFSNAQSPIPVDKDTIPQSVVSLAPGQSAYAMIRTQGEPDGTDPYMTSQVVVYFRGAVGMESVGRSAYASLAKPVGVVDAQAMATYWQSDMGAISAW
ncbi:DUF4232 domain-containing protein [Streptomyces sp. TLI_146]|uniref:DUF4232 domain-containing protein n=1 Tax=Streptomyces sp. TLI_146 TaxID=1938858 RepID=UPI000C70E3A8|nr:DUF4232 domain-containing protein [Streptomyces sp. TLI_146]PKV87125.1 uncharacterized protein DUF4232 [Streptomyces sp. TLI_146]